MLVNDDRLTSSCTASNRQELAVQLHFTHTHTHRVESQVQEAAWCQDGEVDRFDEQILPCLPVFICIVSIDVGFR